MHKVKKIIIAVSSVIFGIPLALTVVLFAIGTYLLLTADFLQPDVKVDLDKYEVSIHSDSLRVCDNSSLLLNKYGLWEARISGNSIDRGAEYGVLCDDLLKTQESS